jgi:hypothetical protein
MTLARAIGTVTAAFACACSSPTAPSPTPVSVPLASSAWETISTPQPLPLRDEGSALTFDFPQSSAGSMNYLYTASPLTIIRGTLVVALRVITSGPVVFNLLGPCSTGIPPSVRPLIWANGNGDGNYDRWWSNPRSFSLAAGTATISVPLQPAAWSSVNGQFGNAGPDVQYQFEKALLNVSRLGLTFGGGCSFGHGIFVTGGSASFALTDYHIQ